MGSGLEQHLGGLRAGEHDEVFPVRIRLEISRKRRRPSARPRVDRPGGRKETGGVARFLQVGEAATLVLKLPLVPLLLRKTRTYRVRARFGSEGVRGRDGLLDQARIKVVVADLHGPVSAEYLPKRRVLLAARERLDWRTRPVLCLAVVRLEGVKGPRGPISQLGTPRVELLPRRTLPQHIADHTRASEYARTT